MLTHIFTNLRLAVDQIPMGNWEVASFQIFHPSFQQQAAVFGRHTHCTPQNRLWKEKKNWTEHNIQWLSYSRNEKQSCSLFFPRKMLSLSFYCPQFAKKNQAWQGPFLKNIYFSTLMMLLFLLCLKLKGALNDMSSLSFLQIISGLSTETCWSRWPGPSSWIDPVRDIMEHKACSVLRPFRVSVYLLVCVLQYFGACAALWM